MLTTQHPSFSQNSNGHQNPALQPVPMQHYPASRDHSQPQQSNGFPNIQPVSQHYHRLNAPPAGPGVYSGRSRKICTRANLATGPGQGHAPASIRNQATGTVGRNNNVSHIQNAHPREVMQSQQTTASHSNMTTIAQNTGGPGPTVSPLQSSQPAYAQPPIQATAKDMERVSTLLEINSVLLREVANLQAQGKAGSIGPTPTSPKNDGSNPAIESPQQTQVQRLPPSQEYAECMRRLQSNLAYLAAIADSTKKGNSRPANPAILVPPSHLPGVVPLYQKLRDLFPEALQTPLNKAMAVASAQAAKNTPATPNP